MNYLKNATILVIDDDDLNLLLMNEYLGDVCKQVFLEVDPKKGLLLAREKQPDIILLDVSMPEINGYEVCCNLKANEQTKSIPVIFLSALISPKDKVRGFDAGGVDYISKPFDIDEAMARIESCLNLHSQIQQSQSKQSPEITQKIQNYGLSEREVEILRLYMKGYTRSRIANETSVTENTVKWHLKNIFNKLEANNRAEIIDIAHQIGL
ncbi:MAG: response regulator [Methylococcaceae bacterium]|nr:response regulator [Methylococcaceae bacterium]